MKIIVTIVSSVVGGEIFVLFLKNIIRAPRPLGSLEAGYSFPSSHAFIAAVFCGLLAYFIYKRTRRKIIFIAAAILAAAVGYFRIYLGVHYWRDVIAGWLLGLVWLALTIYVYKLWLKKVQHPS